MIAPLRIERAEVSDAEGLLRVSVSAFAVDEAFKPKGAVAGGPPGHDNLARQREWIRRWDAYKGCQGDQVVAGCIVKPHPDRLKLFGLFVGAAHMHQGIGTQILTAVMAHYAKTPSWTLETPDYSTGNHRFYEGVGFRLLRQTPVDPILGFGFHIYVRP